MFFSYLFLLCLCFECAIMGSSSTYQEDRDYFSTLPVDDLIYKCILFPNDSINDFIKEMTTYCIPPETREQFKAYTHHHIPHNQIDELRKHFYNIHQFNKLLG